MTNELVPTLAQRAAKLRDEMFPAMLNSEQAFVSAGKTYAESLWLAGDELNACKQEVPHGQWLAWLNGEGLPYGPSSRAMRIRNNYSWEQIEGSDKNLRQLLEYLDRNDDPEMEAPAANLSRDNFGTEPDDSVRSGDIDLLAQAAEGGEDPNPPAPLPVAPSSPAPPAPPAPAEAEEPTEELTQIDRLLVERDDARREAEEAVNRMHEMEREAEIASRRAEAAEAASESAQVAGAKVGQAENRADRISHNYDLLQMKTNDYRHQLAGRVRLLGRIRKELERLAQSDPAMRERLEPLLAKFWGKRK